MSKDLINNVDYYIEGERVIFTALAHIKRGQCCGNGCRHCPYQKNISVATPEQQTSMLSELLEIASKVEQSLSEIKIDTDDEE